MTKVQLQLSFVEEEIEGASVALWDSLDNEHRAEAVAALAQMLAKLAMGDRPGGSKENDND